MSLNATGNYLQVVEDVINNVKAEFESEGVDESVLTELQTLWELKLMQCGAVAGSSHEPELEIVPGLGHGYRGSNPAYLNHLHVASLGQQSSQGLEPKSTFGQPKPFMAKPEVWEGTHDGSRGYSTGLHTGQARPGNEIDPKRRRVETSQGSSVTPQQSNSSLSSAAAQPNGTRGHSNNGPPKGKDIQVSLKEIPSKQIDPKKDDDNDSTLSEDEDDGTEEYLKKDEDPETKNLVLGMYDKVTRVKNKWKCVLKDCILHLNGRDYLAFKANGEFDF